MDIVWSLAVVAGIVAWHNGLHLAPPRWQPTTVRVGTSLAALAGGWWLFTSSDPGRGVVAGLAWTAGTLVVMGTVVAAARRWPGIARLLADRRISAMDPSEFRLHVWLRIPLQTALVEEVLFRGVVWRLLERQGGLVAAWVGSAVAFGLAHVAVARDQARREERPIGGWIGITVLATTVAGLLLGWLRWSTGAIWAPVGVHAAVNAMLALAARESPPASTEPDPGAPGSGSDGVA